ncbi:MAG TPA: hypothetical protein VKQ30_20505 [Ktedonobacterales bacterium]|nr:hypothetical protein [Ktedonobacterales bacterium]
MDDDFEIEVTDLRTGQVLKAAHDPQVPTLEPARTEATPEHDLEVEISHLSATPVPAGSAAWHDGLLAPPDQRPSRRRLAGALATGVLVIAVLTGLLGSVASKGGLPFGLFPTPVPSATLAAGEDTFYMVNGVPWGSLRVDGKQIDVVYSQQDPTFVTLAIGHHTIEYDAPPFPTLRCMVSMPAAKADSCPLFSLSRGTLNNGILDTNRGLDLGATLAHLPPDLLQALINTAEGSLAAPVGTATVPVGGRYQGANGKVAVATEPLQAQAFYSLNTNAAVGMSGTSCAILCDIPFESGGPGNGRGWIITGNVVPTWRYTDSSKTTVQLPAHPPMPDGVASSQQGEVDELKYFSVTWESAWRVTSLSSTIGADPGCFGAMNTVQALATSAITTSGFSSTEIIAPNLADGCLMAIRGIDGNNNQAGKSLWFLYRFGLLFAANPAAHQIFAKLPVPIGDEATLVRRLAPQLDPAISG